MPAYFLKGTGSGGGGGGGGTGGDYFEVFLLDSTDITNKYVILSYLPVTAASVRLTPKGGILQDYGPDYVVTPDNGGQRLSWDGKTLEGLLESGDVIFIEYERTV